jgi:uncharacterized protein with HXXEE motif
MSVDDDLSLEARWGSVLTRGPKAPVRRRPPGAWVWLLPASYLAHIGEELFAGEGFPAWATRLGLLRIDERQFLVLNGVCWLLMTGAVLAIRKAPILRWLLVTLGTVVLINGLAHAAATVITRSYSPGLVTGLAFWTPLGAACIWTSRRALPAVALRGAIFLGVIIHGVVTLIARGGA